jgi:hypothetical protein
MFAACACLRRCRTSSPTSAPAPSVCPSLSVASVLARRSDPARQHRALAAASSSRSSPPTLCTCSPTTPSSSWCARQVPGACGALLGGHRTSPPSLLVAGGVSRQAPPSLPRRVPPLCCSVQRAASAYFKTPSPPLLSRTRARVASATIRFQGDPGSNPRPPLLLFFLSLFFFLVTVAMPMTVGPTCSHTYTPICP